MRAVSIVEAGESAREAARLLSVGASTAIRWIERWTKTGSVDAKPGTGHCRSPLETHRQWLLDLISAEPDLTLAEARTRLRAAKKLKSSMSSIAVGPVRFRSPPLSASGVPPLSRLGRGMSCICT